MNKQEKENLINSLGQKQEQKSLWARTRVIALVFNSLIAGFDRGVGSVAHYARTSDQRKAFKVRRQAIRKAKRDRVIASSKAVLDETVTKAKTSVSGAVNSVKTSVSETATSVKKSVDEKTSAVKKSVADKVEASKAKLQESKRFADAEKERKLAEKLARGEAEKERLAAEQALRAEEARLAEEKRREEERLAEEKRREEERLAEEKRAAKAAMLIEKARQEEARRAKEDSERAAEFARHEAERIAEATKNAEEEEKNKEIDAALKQAEIERVYESKLESTERIRLAKEQYVQNIRLVKDKFAKRIQLTKEKYADRIQQAKATRTAQIEKRRCENAALFRADEELKLAKQLETSQILEAKKEAQRQKREEIERQKLEQERIEAERLKAEADRLEAERLAREEADRIKAEKLEAERREIVQRQQIEAERIRAERVAREEAERLEAERQQYTKNAIAAALAKADEQRRIALVQNKKLERLFRLNAFKESIVSKYNNAKNFATTRAIEVKEHAQRSKEAATQRALDAKAAAAEKAATTHAIKLAKSLAERARSEELAREKAEIKQEKERIALVAAETLRIEKEKEAEALRVERERKEAERANALAKEKEKQRAIDTALKLADDARDNAIAFERQEYARIKDEEKQQKVLERQVDTELKKLRKEADKFAAEEKKKEESAARKQEKDEANFARRKRSLRRAKKFGRSSARLQRTAQSALHKWSAYSLHFVLCIAVSAITCFFVMWLQPSSTMNFRGLWLLNFWPVLITGIALAFLCQNAFISSAINLALWSLLSMANTIKIEVRDDPVYPSDVLLIREAVAASSEYDITIPTEDLGILVGCVIALFLCGAVYAAENKGKIAVVKQMAGKTKCAIVRFGGFVVSLAVLFGIVLGVYADDTLYKQYDLKNYDHVSEVYSSLGFPFSFCHYAKAYSPEKPEGYNEEEAMFYGQNIKTETNDPKVHVIMIMGEAYSDLTDLGIMNFNETNDPQFMFKKMAASKNAISGHIVVPGFAGGTAHTEFDVVTGMQTNMLADSNITAFRSLKDKEESLMSVLHGAGYTTQFEHVGRSWYYNRANAYNLLGADEILFYEDMKDVRYKGTYICDDYVAELIEDRFKEAIDNKEWLFSYNVTIQNHMAYTADKYAGWTLDNVDVMATLTQDTQDAINVYAEGIRDANYMLYRLYNFFNETDEPVMLVFFGDHMPYLGDDMKGYKELGIDNAYSDNKAAALKMYETPYLIWCNDAGAKALDFENAAKDLNLPQDGVIQASYLGSVVLDLIGEGDISQWFSYLSEARQAIPVTKFVTEENEYIDRLRKWTYYKITN